MGRLISVTRPEEEQDVSYETPHRCEIGERLANYLDAPDMLFFPVGTVGAGMPQGVPFKVVSQEPCPACGKYVACWFEWRRRLIMA